MILRRCVFAIFVVCLAVSAASRAHAQARIGEAVVVKNQVVNATTSGQINVGDGVSRDETVATGADSAARLVMADSTNLSLGANASLKLDRSVFNDEHSYRDIAIGLTTGAFRFVTGHSEKTAYKITTPLATIGVRGTILDILSQRGSTTVVLQEGAATVCTLGFQCVQLTQPGDTAIVSLTNGKVAIQKTGTAPWTFSSTCASAAGLCTVTNFADASPPDDPNALCGR
ncbi:MAG TPA: FecR domain-containing protein [Bradyrhizobium sp.]|uniref:FecR family protein n=1 Tax=Bradyrhizobium sp. TaxID=376 RepID=UPI002B7E5C38|nr:FecR domain-containing protein [Bradyrhizobium sp.]HLZ02827.1 FecR domain-containing protein [Bradyrhizobium sp.]